MTSSPYRSFDLSPSLPYAAIIVAAHLAAGLALAAAFAGPAGVALAVLATALGVLAARHRAFLRAGSSPRRLVVLPDGSGRLELRNGRSIAVSALGRRVTRFWIALPIGRLSSVLLTRDMAGADFRRLCLWSLWGRLPEGLASASAARTVDAP